MIKGILLFLSHGSGRKYYVTGFKTVFAINNFKEGIYKLSDFNPSPKGIYVFSNISLEDNIYHLICDFFNTFFYYLNNMFMMES